MNRIARLFAAIVGGLGIAASANTGASAQGSGDEAEWACQEALREGTIEALEEYLYRYPYAPTFCRVLALNALRGFEPDDNNPDSPLLADNYGS